MKVAIVGCRKDRNYPLDKIIENIPKNCSMIISGGAVGIDSLAEKAAKEIGVPTMIFKPDYDKHGRGAPLIRNKEIADNCDMLIAFWDFSSKGTAHVIDYCTKNAVPFKIVSIL